MRRAVDEDVDSVGTDLIRNLLVAEVGDRPGGVRVSEHAFGERIFVRASVVTTEMKALAVSVFELRFNEECGGVVPEISRDVTNPNSVFWRAHASRRSFDVREECVEFADLLEAGLSGRHRDVVQQREVLGKGDAVFRADGERFAEFCNGLVVASEVGQGGREVSQGGWVVGVGEECFAKCSLCGGGIEEVDLDGA